MKPAAGRVAGGRPGAGPDQAPGGIRTLQPRAGSHLAVDDPPGYRGGTGPQAALDTGEPPVPQAGTELRRPPGPAGAELRRPADRADRPAGSSRAGRRPARRRSRRMIVMAAGLAVVLAAVGAADVLGVFGGRGPAHVVVTPDRIGGYVRRPQLEKQANAAALQRQVIAKSAGQASHVVSAVYEDSTGSSPQMILFIGGNLSGVSASGFISSFTQQSKGSSVTSPGPLGGSAACINAQASVPGSVALCTWADNDTFGVVASLTMNATRLAAEMRAMRPMVERTAK